MTRPRSEYEARLESLLVDLRDRQSVRLLWSEQSSASEVLRYPVYQVDPKAKDLLAKVDSLEELANAIGKRKRRPPTVQQGPITRVSIGARTKQMTARSTVAKVRKHLLSELATKTELSVELSSAELSARLISLEGRMANETPYIRRRVAALKKLAQRRTNEELLLRYPQQDYRAYLAGSGSKQVAIRVNGLLLVTDPESVPEVSLPDARPRAKRKDRLDAPPSFQIGRTDYYFSEDWEARRRT